jgi:hypothetical protein
VEFFLLDRKHEHGPGLQLDDLLVDGDRLGKELVDPPGRLAEEKTSIPPGCSGADSGPVDDED